MTKEINLIKLLLEENKPQEAIERLTDLIVRVPHTNDELFYLRGNAYRKLGNWQMAINNYLEAIDINPKGPASHAYEMTMNILNFYNKDMFNQ